jgi:glycosyltransferase involved in cell wall biosynthesis
MSRLAVLVTHPVQYFKPVYQALAATPGLELQVFYGCPHGLRASLDPDFGLAFAWDSAPSDGVPHQFVCQRPLGQLSQACWALPLAWRASQMIRNWRPDAVLIYAYSPLFITASTLLLAGAGLPLLLRADGTDRAFPRSAWKNTLKDLLLRRYYRQFAQVFPIGSDSNDHFARLGVPQHRRHQVSFAVDVNYFAEQRQHWLPQRAQIRQELDIPPGAELLLSVGKMTAVKAPLLVAEALALLPQQRREQLWLIAVGDGPLRQSYEEAMEQQLPGRCRFVGFQNQSQLGRYYSCADTLVFPSVQGETWGLVVNEALQFGLRVIASDHVGCARDLLTTAPNLCFPSGSAQGLADALAMPWHGPTSVPPLPLPEDLALAVCEWLNRQGGASR